MCPRAFVAFVFAAVLAPLPCAAAAPDEAEQHYREGLEAFKRWDFDTARKALAQAYALDPKPRYLWDLAISEVKANHPAEGLTHFRQYLAGPEATAKHREQANALMADAAAKTGHIVVLAPAGAVVSVDGLRSALPDGTPLDVMPGKHVVQVDVGGASLSRDVEAHAGENVEARFNVTAPTAPPEPPVPAATAPPAVSTPLPHSPDVLPPHPPSDVPRWVTAGAVAGVGVAGIVLGGVFTSNASADRSDENAAHSQVGQGVCPQPPTSPACVAERNAASSRVSDTNAATGFFIAGGVLVAAGIATWLLWPSPRKATWSVMPIFGRESAAVQWTEVF